MSFGFFNGGTIGVVSRENSLVGGSPNNNVGGTVTALSNGHYVVGSQLWDAINPVVVDAGAATWGNGTGGTVGLVSAGNSLVGRTEGDQVGKSIIAVSDGNYVIGNTEWDATGPMTRDSGAIALSRGDRGVSGFIDRGNSVIGTAANAGMFLVYAYDPTRARLIVGRGRDNLVSIFTIGTPGDLWFIHGFEATERK